ncbi:unnamed protein product [Arctogadus glacialis]
MLKREELPETLSSPSYFTPYVTLETTDQSRPTATVITLDPLLAPSFMRASKRTSSSPPTTGIPAGHILYRLLCGRAAEKEWEERRQNMGQ